ncbi:MAG TPA: hypothetical protein VNI20_09880 [Fimbriimonadaceae bacterium]|nr:hypothetical protein [Fimbriimonadaceae bacterium]
MVVESVNGFPVSVPNTNLSGNKVEVTIEIDAVNPGLTPGVPPDEQAVGPPFGVSAKITNIKITIGGGPPTGLVYSDPGPYQTDVSFSMSAPTTEWRLASTGWQDGTPINIRVQAHFEIVVDDGAGNLATFIDDYDENYAFTAYNKMQILGTELNNKGVENTRDHNISVGIMSAAISALDTHTSTPSSALGGLSIGKTFHVNGIPDSTAIVDATHGGDDHFMDSFGWTVNPFSDPNYTSKKITFGTDVLQQSQSKSEVQPKYNLAIFYSCSAMSVHAPVGAYEMSSVQARASAGFAHDVLDDAIDLSTGATVDFDKHADIFFAALAAGETLSNAGNLADSKYGIEFVENGVLGTQTMIVADDPATRMKFVYLTLPERFNLMAGNKSTDVNVVRLPIEAPPGGAG